MEVLWRYLGANLPASLRLRPTAVVRPLTRTVVRGQVRVVSNIVSKVRHIQANISGRNFSRLREDQGKARHK